MGAIIPICRLHDLFRKNRLVTVDDKIDLIPVDDGEAGFCKFYRRRAEKHILNVCCSMHSAISVDQTELEGIGCKVHHVPIYTHRSPVHCLAYFSAGACGKNSESCPCLLPLCIGLEVEPGRRALAVA